MPRLFVRNLTVLDFAYLHPQRGVLGESWRVHIELGGDLDDQGMVLDFADVKKGTKRLLDEHFDHRLLVPIQHPGLSLNQDGDHIDLQFKLDDGGVIQHRSPDQAVALIDSDSIDFESVKAACREVLKPLLPGNVDSLSLELETEAIDSAFFHYAHGLKHHCGNCQRIAHGHRSRIEIRRDGQRDVLLETLWARRWKDIYIVTAQDLILDDGGTLTVGYESAQGRFEMTLPADRCYRVTTDSTIENLAQHVAEVTAKETGAAIEVRVFEGIDKGAFGSAG